jgi:hypothetical protein
MRWLRGHDSAESASDLAPVRIFTEALELRGSIAPAGQRVTDILLRGQDLAFLPEGAAPAPEAWVWVAPNDVLFVVPPPLTAPARTGRDLRLIPVTLNVGPYRITGRIHLVAGEEVDPGISARQSFLPVTDARIEGAGATTETVSVAIVNLALATGLRRLEPSGG